MYLIIYNKLSKIKQIRSLYLIREKFYAGALPLIWKQHW